MGITPEEAQRLQTIYDIHSLSTEEDKRLWLIKVMGLKPESLILLKDLEYIFAKRCFFFNIAK